MDPINYLLLDLRNGTNHNASNRLCCRCKGGTSILGSIQGHNDQVAETREKNQAMMDEYKQRLRIRDKQYKDGQQLYATKLGQYDLTNRAIDRAASRAYGIEQYNQSQRLKQAAFQGMKLDLALAKSGGAAAASGKSGRSAQRLDQDIEGAFVRNQNMITQNLLTAEETRGFREMALQDRVQSQRNRAYSQVAIAPTKPLDLIAPRQLSGPSTMGRNLAILNAGIDMASSIAGAFAPNPGGGSVPGLNNTNDFSMGDAMTMGMSQADASTIANGGFVETLIQ